MSESKPLNPRQEEFARLYYAGPDEVRGNATRCYQKAYPNSSYESAKSNAHRLLTHEGVRARIRDLREQAAEEAKARARDWWELYPEAQETLLRALQGELRGEDQDKRSAVEAAREIIDRCEGTARQVHDHRLSGRGGMVVVAGPDHRGLEEESRSEPDRRLTSGPRIVEANGGPEN